MLSDSLTLVFLSHMLSKSPYQRKVHKVRVMRNILMDRYIRLTPENLVDRLIQRHQHLLALRIAEYLNIKTDTILIHWACAKVKGNRRELLGWLLTSVPIQIKGASEDEDATCRTIVEKLTKSPGLSFAEIAKTAYNTGQTRLATKVNKHEPLYQRYWPTISHIFV